jgi:hypothetical protein
VTKKLTKSDLAEIRGEVSPGLFLLHFKRNLDRDTEQILDTLFFIARGGNVKLKKDGSIDELGVPIKDALKAAGMVMDLSSMKEVTQYLLHIATKGRPSHDATEMPDWADDYVEMVKDSPRDPPLPPKKPAYKPKKK